MTQGYTETVFHSNTILDIPTFSEIVHNIPMGYLNKLAEIRERKGVTQDELATRVGVEQPTINRWEKGKREPKFKDLFALSEILEVSVAELLGLEAAPESRSSELSVETLARLIFDLGPSIPKAKISEQAAQSLAVALKHALELLRKTGANDPTDREITMAAHAAISQSRGASPS